MMTFMALLTKELRLRMRRERTIWLMVIYILLLGLAGWFVVNGASAANTAGANTLSSVGTLLYYLLSLLQLFLIVFVTPAFTSTAVNGEKERQTFDLLMCSQLSSLSLVTGKLVGGIANALLLIVSSIPLFSLLFLFGGVAPVRLLGVLLIYVVTAVLVGTFGLLFSILFRRPAISTAITYVFNLLWLASPALVFLFWYLFTQQSPSQQQALFIASWNPILAIISFDPAIASNLMIKVGSLFIAPWISYTVVSVLVTMGMLLLCVRLARPRLTRGGKVVEKRKRSMPDKAPVVA
ncbi:MAG TPA: ABC transporter permease subunit [Ktedonosporobacter sp.]|nr:ABC transporter permease subunit [Ktedonosporobacter sp.]